jgi:hypothetical protein
MVVMMGCWAMAETPSASKHTACEAHRMKFFRVFMVFSFQEEMAAAPPSLPS